MDIKIYPQKLSGKIEAISSKSYAHRALIGAALCSEDTEICLNHISDDIKGTIDTIRALGAKVEIMPKGIKVKPEKPSEILNINCKESGTTGRIILPIMAALREKGTLNGEGSLLQRPFETLCKAMELAGIKFSSYKLPISYEGKLRSGKYTIPGNESSQYISGLMFALPLLEGDSQIALSTSLESKGYIDITLEMLSKFGIKSGYEIRGKQRYISPKVIKIEGDWSNASYWICLGITPTGLNPGSLQKDKFFKDICQNTEIDGREIPDLIPILAVKGTQKKEPTKIYNIKRLRIKESDRIESTCNMIKSLGGKIESNDETMVIYPSSLQGGIVESYNDHRIVMSAAIASCYCKEPVTILNAEAVNKSYGTFFEDFKKLGGRIDVI